MENAKNLSSQNTEKLLTLLKTRFTQNKHRHPTAEWSIVQEKLLGNPEKLWSLHEMENTGGEPDVIDHFSQSSTFVFIDCSPESPKGRRSLCYDEAALDSRKEFKPVGSALQMAANMGIELLDEDHYRHLQKYGNFDLKTSSWICTPPEIRNLGGAVFCDRRYNHVFVYHNGAESYYAVRGFRGLLKV